MTESGETPPTAGEGQAPGTESTGAPKNESIQGSSISDQATQTDSLGFSPYVEAIAEFLTNEETQPPLTLSIEGDWGSGKSSFMKQLQAEIERLERQKKQPAPKVIWFNAWRHDKVEALWAAFALEFIRQISRPRTAAEIIPTFSGHVKLRLARFNWKDGWLDALRTLALLSIGSSAIILLIVLAVSRGSAWSDSLRKALIKVDCSLTSAENNKSTAQASPKKSPASSSPPSTRNPSPLPTSTPSETLSHRQNVSDLCANQPSASSMQDDVWIQWLFGVGIGGASIITVVISSVQQLQKLVGNPKKDLIQYLKSPDYEKQVAFIEQFHEDFGKIVSAYAGKGKKVYVFVDDLDRCELTKAAELMQGLNLLISNDPHLLFVLGMDREKVVAGVALKQKDILTYLPSSSVVLDTESQNSEVSSKALEYGHAFLEKFIQLPFKLPQPSEQNFEDFVRTSSSKKIETSQEPQRTESSSMWRQIPLLLRQKQQQQGTKPPKTEQSKAVPTTSASENLASYSRERIKMKVTHDSDTVRDILIMVAPALDYNPRRIKQFINLFRLKAFIGSSTGLFDEVLSVGEESSSDQPVTLEQLGKFTALCLRYPLLQRELEKNETLLGKLHRYTSPCTSSSSDADPASETEDKMLTYWGNRAQLKELFHKGCDCNDPTKFSLENVKVKQLIQIAPKVVRRADYRKLDELLKNHKWKEANQETLEVMLKIAKQEHTRDQIFLNVDEIRSFPCEDLCTIDRLWIKYSKGKFGFSVQRRIWQECGSPMEYDDKWEKFGDLVGWRDGKEWLLFGELDYDLEKSSAGELPKPIRLGKDEKYGALPGLMSKGRKKRELDFPFLVQRLADCSK